MNNKQLIKLLKPEIDQHVELMFARFQQKVDKDFGICSECGSSRMDRQKDADTCLECGATYA